MSAVRAIDEWTTNGHLLADVARLGYLDGAVLDVTAGEQVFWSVYRPAALTTSDLYKPADHAWDYRALPAQAIGVFDAIVFDPPYKLNGTPALAEQDERYGTAGRTTRTEVLDDIVAGALECYRATKRYLLVKCMDQVEGGRVRWQTMLVARAVEDAGGELVDRFEFVSNGRPQPAGRRQLHARRNYSTLLVFGKGQPCR